MTMNKEIRIRNSELSTLSRTKGIGAYQARLERAATMVKSAVKVMLRTRPTAKFAEDNIKISPDKQNIQLNVKVRGGIGVVNHPQQSFQVGGG
eukprot:4926579-Pyramimonas_sp.AAC.1